MACNGILWLVVHLRESTPRSPWCAGSWWHLRAVPSPSVLLHPAVPSCTTPRHPLHMAQGAPPARWALGWYRRMSPTEQLPVLEGRGRSCPPPPPSALCMLSLCPPSAHTQIADKLRFVLSFKDCLLFTGCGVTSPPSHATTGPTLRMAPPPPKLVAWAGGCTPLLLQQWEWGAAGRSPHCWCWGGPCGWARYDDVVGISLRVDCAVGGSDTGSPLCSPCPFGGGGLWAVPHRTPPSPPSFLRR